MTARKMFQGIACLQYQVAVVEIIMFLCHYHQEQTIAARAVLYCVIFFFQFNSDRVGQMV